MLNQHGFTVDDAVIREGLQEVAWPGRLERFCLNREDEIRVKNGTPNSICYLLDGAHNPAGVESLCEALENDFDYDRLILVWGAMEDKDLSKTLPIIGPQADILILTMVESERSAEPDQLLALLPSDIQDQTICESSLTAALAKAAELAGGNDLICIAGSLYLIGEARSMLVGDLV
jgi:dihydrofolate synthase/folylpolyglutamate synthase